MNKVISNHIARFLLFAFLQIIIFKSIHFSADPFSYGMVVFFPLFIMLIPMSVPKSLTILSAFLLGFTVDIFYDSPGVHASACVFIAYIRPLVFKVLMPIGGYKVEDSPSASNFGFVWFASYASIMLMAYLLFYFSMDAFSFVFIFSIFIKTIFSFLLTIGFILLHQVIFKTKY